MKVAMYYNNRDVRVEDIPKPEVEKEAFQQLLEYDYPGNVRELENILEGAVALHENQLIIRKDLKMNRHKLGNHIPVIQDNDLEHQLENFEKAIIEQALTKNHWNRTAAAEQLGISLRQLRYKMEKLGLDQAE